MSEPLVGYHALDHVLIAIPPDSERRAREFYVDVLLFTEVPRAQSLGGRGGGWFAAGGVSIHLGVDPDFRAAEKAHVAIQVRSLAAVLARCEAAGCQVWREAPLPGQDRIHVRDPFGNRLEFLERTAAPSTPAEGAPEPHT